MTQLIQKRLITVDEYHQMVDAGILRPDDRLELIQGELLHLSPIGSKHLAILNKINQLFVPAF